MRDLRPSDRHEILDLIASYGAAWDAADAEAFAGLFTADGVCVFYRNGGGQPAAELAGRKALRDAVQARAGRFRRLGLVTRHCMSDTVLTVVDPATVRAHTNVRVFWHVPAVDPAPRPVQTGHYDSIVVRTDHGWRFRARHVRLEGLFEIEDVFPDLGR